MEGTNGNSRHPNQAAGVRGQDPTSTLLPLQTGQQVELATRLASFLLSLQGLSNILAFNFSAPSSHLLRDSLVHCLHLSASSSSPGTEAIGPSPTYFDSSSFGIEQAFFSLVSPDWLADLKGQLLRRIRRLASQPDGHSRPALAEEKNVDASLDPVLSRGPDLSGRDSLHENEEDVEKERWKDEDVEERDGGGQERTAENEKERDAGLQWRRRKGQGTEPEEEGLTSSTTARQRGRLFTDDRNSQRLLHSQGDSSESSVKKSNSSAAGNDDGTTSPQESRAEGELFKTSERRQKEKRKTRERLPHRSEVLERTDFFTLWPSIPPISKLRRRLTQSLTVGNFYRPLTDSLVASDRGDALRLHRELPEERDAPSPSLSRPRTRVSTGSSSSSLGSSSSSSSSSLSQSQQEGGWRRARRPQTLEPSGIPASVLSSSSSFVSSSSLGPGSSSSQSFASSSSPPFFSSGAGERETVFDKVVFEHITEAVSSSDGGAKDLLEALRQMTRGGTDDGSEWLARHSFMLSSFSSYGPLALKDRLSC